jgi:hypothetical protein
MTIKTYRTHSLKGYSLHLILDGKVKKISFRRGCTLGSTSTFKTSDPDIQKALESLRSFGPTFFLEKTEVIGDDKPYEIKTTAPEASVVEEEKVVVDMLDAQTFKNLVELRNALKDKGIDVSMVTNVKAAESLAKKNGYNYTVEKNS